MSRPKGGEGASKYVYHVVLIIMRAWMTIKGNHLIVFTNYFPLTLSMFYVVSLCVFISFELSFSLFCKTNCIPCVFEMSYWTRNRTFSLCTLYRGKGGYRVAQSWLKWTSHSLLNSDRMYGLEATNVG